MPATRRMNGRAIDADPQLNELEEAENFQLPSLVLSVNGRTGAVTLTSADVGLGLVLNVAQEPALGNPPVDGYRLASTTTGVRSWVAPSVGGVSSVNGQSGAVVLGASDVGAQSAASNLTAFAGLSLIADRLPYANGAGTLALTTLSPFVRTFLDDADAAAVRTTIGAAAGTGNGQLSYANDYDFDYALAGATTALSPIYTSINHSGSGTYVRKTSNWAKAAGFDLTGMSVYNNADNNYAFTLVSPRHVITWLGSGGAPAPANGTTIRFVTSANVVVSRTLTAQTTVTAGGAEILVGLLNSDVTTCAFYKVLPSGIEPTQFGRAVMFLDQVNQKIMVGDVARSNASFPALGAIIKSPFSNRAPFYADIGYSSSPDHGVPFFFLLGGELVFVGPLYEDKKIYSSIGYNHAAINTAMTSLGGGYQLTDYSTSILLPRFPLADPANSQPVGVIFRDTANFAVLDLANSTLNGADGNPLLSWRNNPNRLDIADTATLFIGADQVLVGDNLLDFVNARGFSYNADNLSELTDFAAARTNLGLGTAATQNTGTSGATIPLLNGANTWTAGQKQIFGANATTAGLKFAGVTADPSSPAAGDIWYRSDVPALKYYDSAARTLLYSGGALGTPSSGSAANLTGFPTFNQDTTGKAAKADALNSATTVVNVSSATAPTNGQVLTATSGTAATWQTTASGFANPMTTLGDVMYENATPAAARLAGSISATKQFLTQTGNGSISAAPAWGTIAAGDIPTLNQSTTGSAATLATPRSIYGNNFDGSAALSQIIASTYGGTGNGFTKFSGPTTAERTKTLRDASDTILELGGSYTPTGTWTNLTLVTPALGTPASGNLANCTFPTLNQNTSGSAASLSATLAVASGGTNLTSYAVGDLLYASGATALSKLADVATGNVLISGGVTTAPSWGKVTTSHTTGIAASGSNSDITSITGSAASLSISGQTGLLTFTGLASTNRAKTVRDAADTILELGGSYTPTGTFTNMILVTPALGTPSALVLTNATGSPTGISLTKAQLNTIVSDDDPAYLGAANTFTANQANSYASTASTAAMLYSGAWLTGGTGTTNFPHFLLQATGTTASTTWSTAGTAVGVNAVTGFTGNFADFKIAGTSRLVLAYSGAQTQLSFGSGVLNIGSSSLLVDSATGKTSIPSSGAASTAILSLTGVPFTGTGTTSFPLVYINDANATASTTLNTAGTYFGVNGDGTQDLMNLLKDGTSQFKVDSTGAVSTSNQFVSNGAGVAFKLQNGTTAQIAWNGGMAIKSPSNGVATLIPDSGTASFGLQFIGTSNSFPRINALQPNGITLQAADGTDTWNDASTANSGTVADRYPFGIAAPTLSSTGTSVTYTRASTLYIGGAPTAGTNVTIGTPYALYVAAGNVKFGGNQVDIPAGGSGFRFSSGNLNGFSNANVSLSTGAQLLINSDVAYGRNAAGIAEITNGTAGQWGAIKAGVRDGGTTTVTNGLTLGHQSTGTPAAGLGTGILFNINSSTTADQNAGQIAAVWTDATHASRTSYLDFLTVNNAGALASTARMYASGGMFIGTSPSDPGANNLNVKGRIRNSASQSISASDIDWSLNNSFYKTLGANTTFTFSNLADGQTIVVALTNTASNYTVTWPALSWVAATAPTQTIGAKTDVYTFTRINGTVYGNAVQNF